MSILKKSREVIVVREGRVRNYLGVMETFIPNLQVGQALKQRRIKMFPQPLQNTPPINKFIHKGDFRPMKLK